MLVKELVELLMQQEQNSPVMIKNDSGFYGSIIDVSVVEYLGTDKVVITQL